jgi:hypothetical protein
MLHLNLFLIQNIYKRKDEWFIISVYNNTNEELDFYKCDQVDGLIKFIKEYFKI